MIAEKLDRARRDLLDLGLRNSLLNYRPLKTRGVEVVDERPALLLDLMVRHQKTMTFLHGREDGKEQETPPPESAEDAGQPDEGEEPFARHVDLHLQTALTPSQLQSRLLQTYYAARTFLEEQGMNVLFLALGMVTWYESDASNQPRRAPLVLLPVKLERPSANAKFRLSWSGEDVDGNLSLVEKLRTEWGVALPMLSETENEEDIEAYFARVREVVSGMKRWEVDEKAVALGFFSFGKLLMYKDLEPQTWGSAEGEISAPLLAPLLGEGFASDPSPYTEEEPLDPHLDPTKTRFVLDADGSQSLVLLDVKAGRSLVVQGPPGTGKSQTITNLIADAIGDGRRVLFVAEKMAALDVVKRRLDSIGVGAACLELHSHKSKKRDVLEELKATLELGRPALGRATQDIEEHRQVRERLNTYCTAINEPLGASNVSPYRALGSLLEMRRRHGASSLPTLSIVGLDQWDEATARGRLGLAREMQHRLEKSGPPCDHAFFGAEVSTLPPTVFERLPGMITATAQALLGTEQASANLSSALAVEPPHNPLEQGVLHDSARLVVDAPDLVGIPSTAREWTSRSAEVLRLVEAGRRLTELHFLYDETLIPEAWSQDVLELRQHLATIGTKWWRMLSSKWRGARARLRGLCRANIPGPNEKRLALVDAIMECQRLEKELQEADALGATLFMEQWRGVRSEWDTLARMAACLTDAHARMHTGGLTPGTLEALGRGFDKEMIGKLIELSRGAMDKSERAWNELSAVLQFNVAKRFPETPVRERVPYAAMGEFLERAETNPAHIHSLVSVNQAAEKFVEEGLGELVVLAEQSREASQMLEDALRHAWHVALVDRAYRERPALARFEGTSHTRAVDRFRELDKLILVHARAMVALGHWNAMPRQETSEGQLGILRREFEKKARHMPIRRLMERAGKAIQAIKPVFLMGPMSVATYLPPGALTFDLVVFDEASQVQPVDAIGALLRGRQAIVVGDSKQLPPTSFFDKLMGSGEEGVEEDAEDFSPSGDLESILGLFVAQQAPQRMLRWHYRSRHESLIALSNREFYDNRLMIFPSPDHDRSELGLVFHHLPDAVYDAGRSRKNAREAEAVADAVMEHARQSPHLSLGVAAFSIPQAEAIRDEVERRRREDPSLEGFFAAHPFEPFFVKNLESVQGDERDVMFISVGYGRDEHGKVSMNFGPLNRDGGERRLNVLITRSKRRCEVFTNLTGDMIDLSRTTSVGVRALRQYLYYAQTGKMLKAASVEGDAQSPFEEEVRQALVARGHLVDSQVGSAGFFIDLAVEDPEAPGRYLLGIECDGASYHAARSARDRDRLRQSVLEGLGWRIHRIWSTDWFRDPLRELDRVVHAIEDARLMRHNPPAVVTTKPVEPSEIKRDQVEEEILPPSSPYEVANVRLSPAIRELLNTPLEQLAITVISVAKVESPIHVEEVCRRILDAAGKRSGTRLQATLMAAIEAALHTGEVQRRGDFLWLTDQAAAPLRDRTNAPASVRRPEFIAPEEAAEAILQAVRLTIGIDEDRVAAVAARLLGLTATAGLRSAVEEQTARLIAENRLKRTGTHLEVAG